MGRVPSSLQGGAGALQAEKTSRAGACLVCPGSGGGWRMAGARYVAGGGVTSWKGQGKSWGEGGGAEEALDVSLGELCSAGAIRAGTGQEEGMGASVLCFFLQRQRLGRVRAGADQRTQLCKYVN